MSGLFDTLPDELKTIRTRPLMTMKLTVRPMMVIGLDAVDGKGGRHRLRRPVRGERLAGEVMEGGSDWQSLYHGSITLLDVRLTLKTSDGALIGVTYKRIRQGPLDIIMRLECGGQVDPDSYYFRINPTFEIVSAEHGWFNDTLVIGIGHRLADGPVYNLFEVL